MCLIRIVFCQSKNNLVQFLRKYYLSFIVKKISKKFNKSEIETENWIDIKTEHLPWVEEFDKIFVRKEFSKLEKFLMDEANKEFKN